MRDRRAHLTAPMYGSFLGSCAVALLLGFVAGLCRADADESGAPPEEPALGVQSHLALERREAERRLILAGAAAHPHLRAWTKDPNTRLRAAAWRVLAHTGTAADRRGARAALTDPQPEVRLSAAEAVLQLGIAWVGDAEPLLPAGSLSGREQRVLASALARRLEDAPSGKTPDCMYRLGEGIVPALAFVCAHPRFDALTRQHALWALATIGGRDARLTLAALQSEFTDRRRPGVWWRALREAGHGPGVERMHAATLTYARKCLDTTSWSQAEGLGWRDQQAFLQFVAACPPYEGLDEVRALARTRLDQAVHQRFWHKPSLVRAVARAHLVLFDPDDESLEKIVMVANPRRSRRPLRWRMRAEEFGAVLMLVEPYRARPAVQRALQRLLEDRERLPVTVAAWALYLQGRSERSELAQRATALVREEDGAGTLAMRHAGALLWHRLGEVPVELIRELLTDTDPWLRAVAVGWAISAGRTGRLQAPEVARILLNASQDADDGVLLKAAEGRTSALGKAAQERLLDMAVGGPRELRGRAWRALLSGLGASVSAAEEPLAAPPASAGLDERLRLAAEIRRRLHP